MNQSGSKISSGAGFKVDYSVMSAQYKYFLGILDECKRCVSNDYEFNEEDVMIILQKLEYYLDFHLAHEEKFMKKSCCLESETYLLHYQLFRDKMELFRQEARFCSLALLTKMCQFSRKWFISHVLMTNTRYNNYLRNNFRIKVP